MPDDNNKIFKVDGSIHGMSLIVGELKGQVGNLTRTIEHMNNNFKMRDDAAMEHRQAIHQDITEIRHDISETKTAVSEGKVVAASVQQDVAEMKNDMADQKKVIDGYVQDRPVAVAAFKSLEELQAFMKVTQETETYNRGFWSALLRIGKVGWVLISALVVAVFSIFLTYGVPYLLEMARRP